MHIIGQYACRARQLKPLQHIQHKAAELAGAGGGWPTGQLGVHSSLLDRKCLVESLLMGCPLQHRAKLVVMCQDLTVGLA